MEEEPPKMRSRWDEDDETEERGDISRKHHAQDYAADSKIPNKENAKEKRTLAASEEKKKKKTSAEDYDAHAAEDTEHLSSNQKKKKKKRNGSRSPAMDKKHRRSSRSKSRERKRSRSTAKSRKPLTEKLTEKLSAVGSRDERDLRREDTRSRLRDDRKRKHSPERPRGSSPSVIRREKERKRSSRSRSPHLVLKERSKDKSKEKKEKKRNRSASKEKEIKKKKKKSKDKKDKADHKEKKEKEGRKEKKSSPKKIRLEKEDEGKVLRPASPQDESESERKRRKSRVDSGISTGSGLGGSNSQEPSRQLKEKPTPEDTVDDKHRLSSKVSDSPLSGPSLSPTPPRSPDRRRGGSWGRRKETRKHARSVVSESPSPPRRQEADSTAAGVEGFVHWGERGGEKIQDGSQLREDEPLKTSILDSEDYVSGVFSQSEEARADLPGTIRDAAVAEEAKGGEQISPLKEAEDGTTTRSQLVNGHCKSPRQLLTEDQREWTEGPVAGFPASDDRGLAEVGREKRREHLGYEKAHERGDSRHAERGDSRHARRFPDESKDGGRHGEPRFRGDRTSEVVERPRDRRARGRRDRSRDITRRRRERTPELQQQSRRDRSAERRSRSIERREWERRDREYSDRERDRYGGGRRYSEDPEFRLRRGGLHHEAYQSRRGEYQRRYSCEYSRQTSTSAVSALVDPNVAGGLAWTEKVEMFLESTRTSTLVELPRDSSVGGGALPSFDPSKPPPLLMAANPVPDYAAVSAYSDPTVPSLDGTSSLVTPDVAALYTPYQHHHSASRQNLVPTTTVVMPSSTLAPLSVGVPNHPRYEAVISTVERSGMSAAAMEPPSLKQALFPATAEIHTAVCVDERRAAEEEEQRSSRERDMKPLTAKEKRRLEMGQKEVWQYVGRKIFTDKVFLRRRKRKGTSPVEDKEELKVRWIFLWNPPTPPPPTPLFLEPLRATGWQSSV